MPAGYAWLCNALPSLVEEQRRLLFGETYFGHLEDQIREARRHRRQLPVSNITLQRAIETAPDPAQAARDQRNQVMREVRKQFFGTPPDHADAAPAMWVLTAEGELRPLPARVWGDDQLASSILRDGRVRFLPSRYSGARARDDDEIAGIVLVKNLKEEGVASITLPTEHEPGASSPSGLSGGSNVTAATQSDLAETLPKHGENPIPHLLAWAEKKYGPNYEDLPGREGLVKQHRDDFKKKTSGISEKPMRYVRERLAPKYKTRGGAPTHKN
ncbi:MAG: hypothetical protein JO001_09315 [Alphaproteobacteria bacterium]|nr:hypothetical protein [Alphaproteobacteria bacterium]